MAVSDHRGKMESIQKKWMANLIVGAKTRRRFLLIKAVVPQDTLLLYETSVKLIKVFLFMFYFYWRSIRAKKIKASHR